MWMSTQRSVTVSPNQAVPVVHDDFDPGRAILPNVSQGRPPILSGLKTLLETGDILPVG
jgi:hypothetical protein